MSILITINGREYSAESGQSVLEIATDNGIYIPTLCNYEGIKPQGCCRVCTCLINGRKTTACTTPAADKMVVETNNQDLEWIRSTIIELLFVEGNHFCPACEKSGSCELQALAYRYRIMVPQFPYSFSARDVEPAHGTLLIDHNRCILCKRCVRWHPEPKAPGWFVFVNRGHETRIKFVHERAADFNKSLAQAAMDICPVGAIIRRGKGYDVPIGRRKYDKLSIGSNIEQRRGDHE